MKQNALENAFSKKDFYEKNTGILENVLDSATYGDFSQLFPMKNFRYAVRGRVLDVAVFRREIARESAQHRATLLQAQLISEDEKIGDLRNVRGNGHLEGLLQTWDAFGEEPTHPHIIQRTVDTLNRLPDFGILLHTVMCR